MATTTSTSSTMILNENEFSSSGPQPVKLTNKRARQQDHSIKGVSCSGRGTKRQRSAPVLPTTVDEINAQITETLDMDMQESLDICPDTENVNDIALPIDIGGLHREIVLDFSFNQKGVVLRKNLHNEPDITKKCSEIHLSRKICESLLENEQDILEASLRAEMGEEIDYTFNLGNNFFVYTNSNSGYDVMHIRKIYNYNQQDKAYIHSNTGMTFKFSEIKYFLHLLKKIVNLLTYF